MLTIDSPHKAQVLCQGWRREYSIALVPTMGALHEGHLSLVRRAKDLAQKVVVSIFVNPLQFGPTEDLDKYPRTLKQDEALLREANIDMLFLPEANDFYSAGFSTVVRQERLSQFLCGKSRPNFFQGVATVCTKLFNVTLPHVAVFGEKDFQQLRVLEQLVADLNLPMRIERHPTVREADGLALSSRNRYLSPEERDRAGGIPAALRSAAAAVAKDPTVTAGNITATVREGLKKVGLDIDYVDICSSEDLHPVSEATEICAIVSPRLFIAGYLNKTRMIDNVPLLGNGEK